jgi:hypothetical protein
VAFKKEFFSFALSRLKEWPDISSCADPSGMAAQIVDELIALPPKITRASQAARQVSTEKEVGSDYIWETAGSRKHYPELKELVVVNNPEEELFNGIGLVVPPEDFWEDDDERYPAREEIQTWYTPHDEFDRMARAKNVVFWPPQKMAIIEELRQTLTREAIYQCRHCGAPEIVGIREEARQVLEAELYETEPVLAPAASYSTKRGGRPPSLVEVDGKKIAALRGDIKQEAFAEQCGFSPDTLQAAEIRNQATPETLSKICKSYRAKTQKLKPKDFQKIVPDKPGK